MLQVLGFLPMIPAETPTPLPYDPDMVTPGVIGFVVTIAFIVASILLLVSMNRRIRRVNYRAEIAERLDAEEAASGEAADGDETDGRP